MLQKLMEKKQKSNGYHSFHVQLPLQLLDLMYMSEEKKV
jgi:hypothetical protein